MYRQTLLFSFFSVLLGVAVGAAAAFSALTINAWNPQLEFKKAAEIIKESAEKASNPDAKVSIAATEYDFGIKNVKERGTHDFEIKNAGTAVLTLEVNQTTCTCTGIDLSRKSVLPGQTAVATVRYDAERATTGPYHQGGTIVTNDPEHREMMLSIKGIFTDPIVAEPNNVIFPTVHPSETPSATVRIYGYEKNPLEIQETVWNSKEHFDLTLKKSELTQEEKENSMKSYAGSVYEAKITVKPAGLPMGTFQEKFQLKTNYPSEPTFDITVRGQITGSGIKITGMGFIKDTGVLLLGTVQRGQGIKRDVSIQWSGTAVGQAALQVKSIKPDFLKATLAQPKPAASATEKRRFYTLTVEVPPSSPMCNFTKADEQDAAMITLETGLSDTPTVKIPVHFAVEQ